MKVIKGDLIKMAKAGEFHAIAHGCNCQCAMGAGIALAIKKKFPEAYYADRATQKGDLAKLGTFTKATVALDQPMSVTIYNLYTQAHFSGPLPRVNVASMYDALKAAKEDMLETISAPIIHFGIPFIGAGLAGGDKQDLIDAVEALFDGNERFQVSVVEFNH